MEWDQYGEPESAARLGRYTLLTKIAEGSLTTVYLARQQSDAGFARLVALKLLRAELAGQREYVELLQDEAHIGAGLNHANLVAAIDVGAAAGECFVAYEYVEGDSLAGLLGRPDAVRHPRFLAPLMVDVLSGLHAAHHALGPGDLPIQLVHQAPRAEHILVGIDGIARIADFGQVRSPALRPNRLRTDRLKVGYMAPEQVLRPDVVDHRADIFILGITFWEALTGRRLFDSYSEEQSFQNLLHRAIQAPSEVNRALPSCFDDICLRALEREPEDRYESAADMARELRDTAINHALFATAPEVGQWVKAQCGTELIARRRLAGSESPSQQMRVDPSQRAITPFFDEPSGVEALPDDEPSQATTPHLDEPSPATAPSFDEEEITTLHLAPTSDADSDEVPILMDEFSEDSETRTTRALVDESVVAPLRVPEGYQRNPDSGELPDFSDPDHEAPTRVFDGAAPSEDGFADAQAFPSEHEVPTRLVSAPSERAMPAPSERASALGRELASRGRDSSVPAEAGPTPAYGTSLWMPEQRGSVPPARAGSSRPPASPGAPRPRGPNRDFREENAPPRERSDSTPTRMRLSSGPVGDVFGSSAPPPASSEPQVAAVPPAPAAPSVALPPSAPPPIDELPLSGLDAGTPFGGGSGVAPDDSLTPPSQSHTLPPPEPDFRGGGRRSKWVVAGLVAAAAAVALAFGLSGPADEAPSMGGRPEGTADPEFVGATPEPEPQTGETEPASGSEEEATEPQATDGRAAEVEKAAEADDEAAPDEVSEKPTEEPAVVEDAAAAKPPVTRPAPRASGPAARKRSRRAKPKPARPRPSPAARPTPAPAAPSPSAPPPAEHARDWRTRGDSIPDNPF